MDYKTILGALAAILALVSYIPYLKDILQHRTKPHAFSWLVWSVLGGIGYVIQLRGDGGAGAWALGLTALVCFGIFVLSLRLGTRYIVRLDMVSLALAACSLLVWALTGSPLLGALCITLTDGLGGFLPTFRKSFYRPYDETVSTYAINAVVFVLSIAALTDRSLSNVLYPASLVLLNGGLTVYLLARRRRLGMADSGGFAASAAAEA